MATRSSHRRGGFPWGLVLLGLGGWLWYEHSKQTAAAAATPTPTTTTTLPPTTTTTTALPASTTPAQLQAPATDARSIVLQAAQHIGTQAWMSFAQTGSDADIATMANIITGEWAQYGRCQTDQCTATWGAIANKYNLY